jgi:Uma2 family endonuclease
MSAPSLSVPVTGSFFPAAEGGIAVGDRVRIPASVRDLESFREWAHSGDYPERGGVSFLDGEIWVDLSMEELVSHNLVKSEFAFALMSILRENSLGEFIADRMLLTNTAVGLSTEPDGMVLSWQTLKNGRVEAIAGKDRGYVELRGSPDLVLEVVSDSSHRKDCVTLRQMYQDAGIGEYWLVDVRGQTPYFEILTLGADGYRADATGEWQTSPLLGRQFRLASREGPQGHARFTVEWRAKP